MPLRRPLLLAAAIVLGLDAAHADPCPPPNPSPFRLSAIDYQGHVPIQVSDTQQVNDECAPIALDGSFADGADSATNSVQVGHGLGMQANVAAAWGGADGAGVESGGGAEIDDFFQVTGVAGPTAPVQIAVNVTGGVATLGSIEPSATEARGSFIVLSDTLYQPDGNEATAVFCQDNHGTVPIACHTTLHGTVPVGEPVYFTASLYVDLVAAASATHPTGSGSSSAAIALAFQITAPGGGTIERGATQYLPEPDASWIGVVALGALGVSSRRRRAPRRSPRSRRPASACS